MYFRALGTILPIDVTALFSSAPAFVYPFKTWIFFEVLIESAIHILNISSTSASQQIIVYLYVYKMKARFMYFPDI